MQDFAPRGMRGGTMTATLNGNTLATATQYLNAGLCVLPARLREKRPNVSTWTDYQSRLPVMGELRRWFPNSTAVCLVAGAVSGNLELMDFDFKAELWHRWCGLVEAESPGLLSRLVVERSQSGGKHAIYRCEATIPGNRKLAERNIPTPNGDEIEVCGKKCKPQKVGDGYQVTIALIETRGEGGLFLCAPSPGYVLEAGSFAELPLLTESERAVLIDAARALNEAIPAVENTATGHAHSGRPGDEYNDRGDVRGLLQQHGWKPVGGGQNEYWRRPGKELGQSATLKDRAFYVFSSNAAPFEPDKAYAPFSVYALLEHNGDFKAAAVALREQGYGKPANSVTQQQSGLEITRAPKLMIRSAGELLRSFPELRRMVIEGLLRIGEVMNIIAPSKFGKSWLVLSLVFSVACGLKWLGRFVTVRGKVLLIDNELHPETLASRFLRVAMAMGLKPEDYQDRVSVISLRGDLMDLRALSFELMLLEHGAYDLIVLDAMYRLQPSGTDENSNGDVTALYNLLESVSAKIGSAFACIHHSTKGSQSGKSVTDVGSGAGAQSRAADSHVVLRQHEADDAVTVDAAVRSWAPIKPFCMRWEFPIWTVDELLDPSDLKRDKPRGKSFGGVNDKADPDDEGRGQIMSALRDQPAGASQSAIRKVTGFNGPKFLKLVEHLIKAGRVEYIPKEDSGARADIYKATDGLQVQTYSGPDQKNQTYCADTQSVHGSGLAPYRGPDLDRVSDPGSAPEPPTLADIDVFDVEGDYR